MPPPTSLPQSAPEAEISAFEAVAKLDAESLLHVAIRHVDNDGVYPLILDYLLAEDVDLDAVTALGDTPLHYAVAYAKPMVVKWLLVHGVDVWIRNALGELAVDLSVKLASRESGIDNVRQEVTGLLQMWMPEDKTTLVRLAAQWKDYLFATRSRAMASLWSAALLALREYDFFRFSAAVDSGLDVNEARDETGLTLLMAAARAGALRCVTFLLERGASTGRTDADGRTALHFAIQPAATDEHVAVVAALLDAGASPLVCDAVLCDDGTKSGATPLAAALALRDTRPLDRIASLLSDAERAAARPAGGSSLASARGLGRSGKRNTPRSKRSKRAKRSTRGKRNVSPRRRVLSPHHTAKSCRRRRRRKRGVAKPRPTAAALPPRPKRRTALDAMDDELYEQSIKDKFSIGDRVVYKGNKATVRYVGRPLFADGVWVGLALDEPRGRHHGVVDGKQYFRANVNCGIFAQPAAVVRLAS
ncbi:uncharacterized protein AMSG_00281 [Thecamonas trahens ATCC 50062]|uniref:CAP-Gly domain-containing protein n=1 Tax=Thecamonas trahens ATCC 50062 TaxID=461836 RepID=A0A0L0D1N7_THETB|nr:hypothetical protein AMSG_00281 [Thecamonas trahens ATCC 50062]KNC46162.1 hypothetical protein AMSG_00281 [Thecamonas trahens ATCC 50062]|eukprot:XP_013763138.1 hypothetical protein AMSG_00281 [Thecamonas trahens ATCC 50062]